MRRVFLILLSILLVVLCSCELTVQPPKLGKVHILVYGNDYGYADYGSTTDIHGNKVSPMDDGSGCVSKLGATLNDAAQVALALCNLSERAGLDYSLKCLIGKSPYMEDELERYGEFVNDVSKTALIEALDDLSDSSVVSDNDMVFIYLCGHGDGISKRVNYGEDVTERSHFIAHVGGFSAYSTRFPVSEILSYIEKIPGTKVVLSDFCYSGAMIQPGYVSVNVLEYNSIDTSKLFDARTRINENSSIFSLSAARYYEVSQEIGYHGYFTKALLEALGWNESSKTIYHGGAYRDGCITFFDVAKYVTKKDNAKQTPMFSGGSNDLVLFSF